MIIQPPLSFSNRSRARRDVIRARINNPRVFRNTPALKMATRPKPQLSETITWTPTAIAMPDAYENVNGFSEQWEDPTARVYQQNGRFYFSETHRRCDYQPTHWAPLLTGPKL